MVLGGILTHSLGLDITSLRVNSLPSVSGVSVYLTYPRHDHAAFWHARGHDSAISIEEQKL